MAGPATKHFIHQRATALIQIPLVIWLVISLVRHAGDSRAEFMVWLSQPINAALLTTFVLSVGYHMYLGMGEVIDDYIHSKGTRTALSALNAAFALACVLGSLFSIITITLIA